MTFKQEKKAKSSLLRQISKHLIIYSKKRNTILDNKLDQPVDQRLYSIVKIITMISTIQDFLIHEDHPAKLMKE